MSGIKKLAAVYELKQARPVTPTVLVLDDQSTGRLILAEVIKGIDKNIKIVMFSDPLDAIEYARNQQVDLVLTDYKMPVLDGIETIRRLRTIYPYEQLPIVMATVVNERDIRYRAFEAGATDFLTRPMDPIECRVRCQNLLTLRQQYLVNSSHARLLEDRIEKVTRDLRLHEVNTLIRLAGAAGQRDAVVDGHWKRMAKYSGLIARGIGLSEDEAEAIELAAPIHDIGKIGVPDSILQKRGGLSAAETMVMQTHAHVGHDILKNSSSKFLQIAAVIALHHHEKFDGAGYPAGLRGKDIPLQARIVALADVFDALLSERPYKAAWSWDKAATYIVTQRGRHFDPELVDVFIAMEAELRLIQQTPAIVGQSNLAD